MAALCSLLELVRFHEKAGSLTWKNVSGTVAALFETP
jgi:hypothetical protein